MLGVDLWEKVFVKNERKDLSELRKTAVLYGSKTWYLRENEMVTLKRTEKAMMKTICGVNLIEKRKCQEILSLLILKDTLDVLARASGVRWCGHVLRRDNGDV